MSVTEDDAIRSGGGNGGERGGGAAGGFGARGRRWLLAASLSLNLLVAGVLAGSFIGTDDPPPPEPAAGAETGRDRPSREERMLRLVPQSKHDAYRRIVEAQRPDRVAVRDEMAAVHARIIDTLRAEPFEPAAFDAALAERRALSAELWTLRHDTFVTLAEGLDDAERATMAARFEALAARWAERVAEREAVAEADTDAGGGAAGD